MVPILQRFQFSDLLYLIVLLFLLLNSSQQISEPAPLDFHLKLYLLSISKCKFAFIKGTKESHFTRKQQITKINKRDKYPISSLNINFSYSTNTHIATEALQNLCVVAKVGVREEEEKTMGHKQG